MLPIIFVIIVTNIDFIVVLNFESSSYIYYQSLSPKYIIQTKLVFLITTLLDRSMKEKFYQKHMVDIIFIINMMNMDFIAVRNFESTSYILLLEEVTKYIIQTKHIIKITIDGQRKNKKRWCVLYCLSMIFVTIITNIDFITVRNFESASYILLLEEVTKYIIQAKHRFLIN